MPRPTNSFTTLGGGVPVQYARYNDPRFCYGTRGKPYTFYAAVEFENKLDECFKELWRVCPLGRAEVVTSAGAYVNKPGSHGQGRGFDLDAIFWADKNFITLHYPQDRRFYLGVEAILRKHFERFPAPHLSLAGSSLYCIYLFSPIMIPGTGEARHWQPNLTAEAGWTISRKEQTIHMDNRISCNCKTGCTSRRCSCLKNNQPCNEKCGCENCQNPLNGVDVEALSICAIQNIQIVKDLSQEELDELLELPCGCEKVPVKKLLNLYTCSKCGDQYWYSFYWGEIAEETQTWHCEVCGTCRDWREWHCEVCNKCTYGISLPCENCRRSSRVAELFSDIY